MFGYIYPFKPDLKIRYYNKFKSYYCSLCHAIKNNYGNIPRMTLNFDTTFMAIFLDSLTNNNPIVETKRCMVHPVEKKFIMKNLPSINYASHITIILTHNKILDDINDENNLFNKIILPFSNKYIQKLPKNLIPLKDKIELELENLKSLEKSKEIFSIDEYSHPFSNLTKIIFEEYGKIINLEKDKMECIKSLGYNLGKWIYILDGVNDIEKDFKNNSFNPILHIHSKDTIINDIKDFKDKVKDTYKSLLTFINHSCLESFNKLKTSKNYDLIENILQLGMPFKADKVMNKENLNKKGVSINSV